MEEVDREAPDRDVEPPFWLLLDNVSAISSLFFGVVSDANYLPAVYQCPPASCGG